MTLLRRLRRDQRGTSALEFAIIAPTMCMMLMGLADLSYQAYVQSILTGAIQKAGRDSTIQGATTKIDAIDAKVMGMVKNVAKNATHTSTRKSYASFSKLKPEYFEDKNDNDTFDSDKECFIDINDNNTWDADPGLNGQGGANDVVLYSIQVRYGRLFPLYGFLGWGDVVTIGASTVLKNQPWAQQNVAAEKEICPKKKKKDDD